MGANLVGQALGFQLLFFERLLQSENLGLVLLHGQLHHLARLGDPLIGSRPAREEAQPCILPLNAVFLSYSLQSKSLTHFRLGLKLPCSSKSSCGD